MPFHVEATDFVTIGLLIVLEALLSADNALVLAVLVLPLPKEHQNQALRYGILGAFLFRIVATVFAVHLISWSWIKLVGGLYLLYLPVKHFAQHEDEASTVPKVAGTILGLSIFWSTVVRVELTDVVFAIDSILVAVAMSPKLWVVISGGLLGILAMRLLIGQILGVVRRYPAIVHGAYVIVAWVGIKLLVEYAHAMGWIPFEFPRWFAIGVVFLIFGASALYARRRERASGASALVLAVAAAGALVAVAPPAAAAEAREPLRPYEFSSDLLATTPSTDDGAIGATLNPAQWGVLERPEFSFFWSDANVRPERLDNWGFAMGKGAGLAMRRVEERTSVGVRRVVDWQVGTGAGTGAHHGGLAFGFSGPGKGAFGRSSYIALGEISRPARWLSYGTSTQFALGDPAIQGVADVGVRPFSDPRLLLFADYALRRGQRWDDGALGAGVATRPFPGLSAALKWGKDDRLQVTLGVALGRTAFRAAPRYDRDGRRGVTQYAIRRSSPEPGFDLDGALHRGRRTMALDLHGRAVYQSYRFFDEEALPLRDLIDRLEFAQRDSTVGGVALHLSGFQGNVEMAWEIRSKLLELRRAGKRVQVACDDLTAPTLLLALAADRVVMDPRASMIFPGVQVSRTYLRGLLGKLGLGFEEWRFYKYKSAMETLSRDRMSDADREQWDAIARAEYDEIARAFVASGRATREEFDRVVNQEPYVPAARLLELHWIDRIGRWEDLEDSIAVESGGRAKPEGAASLRERRWRPDPSWGRPPTVAVVYLVGDCAMDEGIRARESSRALRELREDGAIDAVVLRVDSPGGDPLASDLVANETRKYPDAKKPILVSQGRVAGSGGYWISMDGDQIATSPFTLTGSIGVIGGWLWNAGFGGKTGLTSDRVQVGRSADLLGGLTIPFLGATLPERNLNEGERRLIERSFASMYDDFTGSVARARGLPVDRVRALAQGRVYDGRAAVGVGLADRVASLEETILEAARRAGIRPGARIRVVEYPKRPLFRLPSFLGGGARSGTRAPFPGASYEARTLQTILDRPGRPLLLMPGASLPAETEAVR
ncbi:MAG TPA: S49 family peptidase [Candidatus Eisenbacteria bacterium]